MDEFQMEVVQRLSTIEAKLDNGILGEIRELKEWTKEWRDVHPLKCPLIERKANIGNPIVVGLVVGLTVLLGDVIVKVVLG